MDAPTATLLWAACRPTPRTDGVRAAVSDGADLERAAGVAVTQRVSPLLWRALTAAGAVGENGHGGWPATLRRDAGRCRAQALMLLPALGPKALEPLAAAGLVPLVFKGAALADRYSAPGLRPMDDVDLVVPPDHLDATVSILQKAGWRVVPPKSAHHEVILVHEEVPGLPIEVHRALATWRERSNHLTTADLWAWRAPGTIAGAPAFVLPLEEEIVALAAHAAKPFHVFDRLIWTVDIAVVVEGAEQSGRTVDWDKVERLASAARCRTGLAVALTQAERLGVASPPELRESPANNARARALLPLLSAEWPLLERGWGTRSRLRYALVDDWRQRVTLLVGQGIEGGAVETPRRIIEICVRGVRRWVQLRREASRSGSGGD